MRKYLLLSAMAMALTAGPALAQDASPSEQIDEGAVQSVELSAAELVETKNTMSIITQEVLERKNADNLMEALRMEPGIQMNGNGVGFRGSSYVNIRGFDQSRIGIMLDGIPLANTWGREFDFARISTFDMGSIEVSKGYSSPLLGGTHSIGGVIDIQSSKPVEPFEFKAMYKNQFDREFDDMGREFGTSIGTKQEDFYLKASYHHKKQDFFTPSAKAQPAPGDKKGGRRSSSSNEDQQLNLMAGWTPTEDVDIMLGYFWHDAEKNTSGNYAPGGRSQEDRFYWPDWNTERIYLTANIAIDENSYFKGTVYYDEHKDTLLSWAKGVPTSFGSTYDDSGWGTHIEYGYTFNERHKVVLAANYRSDEHEEDPSNNTSVTKIELEGYNYDFGAEYTYKPADPLSVVLGLNYAKKVGKYFTRQDVLADGSADPTSPKVKARNKPEHDALNWQLGIFYNLTPEHEIHFTYARKTNTPSYQQMYDRVRNIFTNPSPPATPVYIGTRDKAVEIDPETADHFEVGYKGDIGGWLQLSANIFYSRVNDMIATNPDYDNSKPGTLQFANIGRASLSGYELGLQAEAADWLTIGGNLSYLKTHRNSSTTTDSAINRWVIDKPKFMANAYMVITPFEEWRIIPSLQAVGARYDLAGEKLVPGFARVDLKTTYDLTENIMLQVGVENIGDVNYGYSGSTNTASRDNQPGRNYYAGITYTY